MRNFRFLRLLIIAVLLFSIIFIVVGCGKKEPPLPPYYGAFLIEGQDLIELPKITIVSSTTEGDLVDMPQTNNEQPGILFWQPDTRLQYLQFFTASSGQEVEYNARPGAEEGILEIHPANPLSSGKYCLVQGDPLGMGLPAWCFEVQAGGISAQVTVPATEDVIDPGVTGQDTPTAQPEAEVTMTPEPTTVAIMVPTTTAVPQLPPPPIFSVLDIGPVETDRAGWQKYLAHIAVENGSVESIGFSIGKVTVVSDQGVEYPASIGYAIRPSLPIGWKLLPPGIRVRGQYTRDTQSSIPLRDYQVTFEIPEAMKPEQLIFNTHTPTAFHWQQEQYEPYIADLNHTSQFSAIPYPLPSTPQSFQIGELIITVDGLEFSEDGLLRVMLSLENKNSAADESIRMMGIVVGEDGLAMFRGNEFTVGPLQTLPSSIGFQEGKYFESKDGRFAVFMLYETKEEKEIFGPYLATIGPSNGAELSAPPANEIDATENGNAATTEAVPTFERPLYLTDPRMSGDDVLALQQRLFDLGYTQVGEIDGYYGPMTDNAVKAFQEDRAYPSGTVDAITWNMLFPKLSEVSDSEATEVSAERSPCALTSGMTATAETDANLWSDPDVTKGTIIATVDSGTELNIVGDSVWGRIRIDRNDEGWWWPITMGIQTSGWIWQGRIEECR